MTEGEVPRGPLRAAVRAVTAPFRAWLGGVDDEAAASGAVLVGYDAKGRPVYAPLGPGRRPVLVREFRRLAVAAVKSAGLRDTPRRELLSLGASPYKPPKVEPSQSTRLRSGQRVCEEVRGVDGALPPGHGHHAGPTRDEKGSRLPSGPARVQEEPLTDTLLLWQGDAPRWPVVFSGRSGLSLTGEAGAAGISVASRV